MRLLYAVVAGAVAATMLSSAPALAAEEPSADPRFTWLPSAVDVVADPATERVFVSTGADDSVYVLDWDGNYIAWLPGIEEAGRMALDADTGTVYVTEPMVDKIAAIDTTTFTVTHYATPGTRCPYSLAVDAGKVYYGYTGTACDSYGGVGVLDPAAAQPLGVVGKYMQLQRPLVAAHNGTVVVVTSGRSRTNPSSYSVSDAGWTDLGSRSDIGDDAQDVAFSPGGREVVIAQAFPFGHQAFNPSSLATLHAYISGPSPNAVAYSPDSSLLATGSSNSPHGDIRTFAPGDVEPLGSWDLDAMSPAMTLLNGGLAMGGSSRLFALTTDSDDEYLMTIDLTAPQEPSLTLSAPTLRRVDESVGISGTLFGGGSPMRSKDVTITRTKDGLTTEVGIVTTNNNAGSFWLEDTPPGEGTYEYRAVWEGDDWFAAAAASTVVEVQRRASAITVSTDADTYAAGEVATVTVQLGHVDVASDSVALYRVTANGTRLVSEGGFDGSRTFVTDVPARASGHFTAEYAGSRWYAPTSGDSAPYSVQATSRSHVVGAFMSDGDVWSVLPSITPTVEWTVKPSPVGPCARTIVQQRTSTGWQTLSRSACVNASNQATFDQSIDEQHSAGTRWRVRLKAGETATHLALRTPWTYITFRSTWGS